MDQATDYYLFGESFDNVNVAQNRYLYNGKELQDQAIGGTPFGWYDYGARFYDPEIGRWHSVDPLAEDYASWTGYHYVHNNPINLIDPNGMNASTHTDSLGNVVAVYDDGDLGVYKHNGNKEEAKKEAEENHNDQNTSANGEKMGETENWDEFVNPETGKVMDKTRIQFGKSFDPIIDKYAAMADGMDLREIAARSGGGGLFDIKDKYKNVGALLNGKYATSRSAGNYLAGYNAARSTYFGFSITFDTFQKLAGALHIKESQGVRLSTADKADIILVGTKYGPPPTYGEQYYQYRMSRLGWFKAKIK